jgi:hypothetical protein
MQKIAPLTQAMADFVESKRDWVRNHFVPESINEYNSIDGKLSLLNTILKSDWIEPTETYKLQSLGITLGDIIVQDLHVVWIEVNDEYGDTPAVQLPGTTIIIYPMTMLSKRIEAGETINIYELHKTLKEYVAEVKTDAAL